MQLAVTDTAAQAISSVHGYTVERVPWRARATIATVATTIMPSTITGHIHACMGSIPARLARSVSVVADSQNAHTSISTVPARATTTAHIPVAVVRKGVSVTAATDSAARAPPTVAVQVVAGQDGQIVARIEWCAPPRSRSDLPVLPPERGSPMTAQ